MGKPKRVKRRRLHSGQRLTVWLRSRPGLSYHTVTAHDVQAALPTKAREETPVPMVLLGLDEMGVLPDDEPDRVRHHEWTLGWLVVRYRPRRRT